MIKTLWATRDRNIDRDIDRHNLCPIILWCVQPGADYGDLVGNVKWFTEGFDIIGLADDYGIVHLHLPEVVLPAECRPSPGQCIRFTIEDLVNGKIIIKRDD